MVSKVSLDLKFGNTHNRHFRNLSQGVLPCTYLITGKGGRHCPGLLKFFIKLYIYIHGSLEKGF